MCSALRTKVFEGNITPQVQRWIADNPLRRHGQTLDFQRWWQTIMGYPLQKLAPERQSQTTSLLRRQVAVVF